MKKKGASIGAAALLTAGTLLYLAFNRKRYYVNFLNWKKGKIENMYYNNIDERDIAWG